MGHLTRVTKKDEPFGWKLEQQMAFVNMVTTLTKAPASRYFDYQSDEIINMNDLECVSPGVLAQQDDERVLHPVAYFSKKRTPAECNYDIYGKELLAIIMGLENWGPVCEGVGIVGYPAMQHDRAMQNPDDTPSSE